MSNDPVSLLREQVQRRSSLRALAREWKCSAPYVSDVLLGKRPPGPKILKRLGLKRVVRYEYVRAS